MWKETILLASTLTFIFEEYLCYRQFKRLHCVKTRLPELKPLLEEEDFQKTRSYSIDKMKFGFFSSIFNHILACLFIIYNFYPWLWNVSAGLLEHMLGAVATGGWPGIEIIHSLVFLSLATLISTIIQIPFNVYSTFVVEQKHGFNNQTISLFISDIVKGLLLGAIIGYPCIAFVLWLIRKTGDLFYLYTWAFMVVFQLVMLTIYPTLIQPLFNKVEPLADGELKTQIEILAKSVKFPLTKLFVIDGSKRSNHSNAYFYGFFNNKRIVLFDTLLEQVEKVDEILAVLAHEIGHWYHSHTIQMLLVSQAQILFIFYMFSFVNDNDEIYKGFGFGETSIDRSYIPIVVSFQLFSMIYAPFEALLSFAMNIMSRKFEYQADQYAKNLKMEKYLVNALLKLSVKNKGMIWPDEWFSAWNHSHPTVVDRIRALGVKLDGKDV